MLCKSLKLNILYGYKIKINVRNQKEKKMPKFEIPVAGTSVEELVAREFIAVPVLGGNTDKLKEVLAELGKRGGTCVVFIADLNPDENGADMPLVTKERQTKGGGSASSVVYAESTDLFAGINDEGTPLTFTARLRRKVSGGAEVEIEESESETETETTV
jgi:hypothetical protein